MLERCGWCRGAYVCGLIGIDLFMIVFFFFFKQKTAYEIGTGDWSSDVCSSDLLQADWLLLENEKKATLEINMPYF